MHPGVWLAFGDVNGEDFWCNKGRIEHVAFSTEPSLLQERLVFATRSRLVAAHGTSPHWFRVSQSRHRAITQSR